jgi:ABC-type glycerol-3-phosphate transport system permease component
VAALFAIPFAWLALTSVMSLDQIVAIPPQWIPKPVRWENYVTALTFQTFPFPLLLRNTLFYAGFSTLGQVVASAVVAYAFARMRFWGRDVLFGIMLATMMVPWVVTLIPSYVLFRKLGWVGTYAPLIGPSLLGSPFNIFLLRQFMMTIPQELTDAARIDGAGDFAIFRLIMLPMVKPALMVVGLFQFLSAWNDFFGPLIYLDEMREYPLVLGLYTFVQQHFVQWDLMMAAAMAVTLPLLVLFFVAQRYFIEGIALTGLKG